MATNVSERQYPLAAIADTGIANMGAGNEVTFDIPPGAFVYGVTCDTVTAFNSVTTATITVSDGSVTFVAAQDLKTLGRETAAVAHKLYPSGGTITVSLAETGGAATVGRNITTVLYVLLGRAHEVQG